MRIKSRILFSLLCLSAFIGSSSAADGDSAQDGQTLAFDRNKGNCLACHAIPNDPKATSPGNIGPSLIGMKSRFPVKAKLRAQIWDATAFNPKTAMPPFGKNKVLTDPEIDRIVDYLLGM